jgi:hypothetical protein
MNRVERASGMSHNGPDRRLLRDSGTSGVGGETDIARRGHRECEAFDPKWTAAASDEGWRSIANHIRVALTLPATSESGAVCRPIMASSASDSLKQAESLFAENHEPLFQRQ